MENDLARIEKALFGHETEDFVEVGLFEQAHNGTLYLDNVSHFPMEIQSAILKFILKGNFTRVGGNDEVNVDTRILSSCSASPGRFG